MNPGDVVPRFLHQDGGKLVPLATRAHPKDDRIEQTPCILALAPISFGGLTSLMIGSISSQRSPGNSEIVSSVSRSDVLCVSSVCVARTH